MIKKLAAAIRRMVGSGPDAGYHLGNLITFVFTALALLLWLVAYVVEGLRSLA